MTVRADPHPHLEGKKHDPVAAATDSLVLLVVVFVIARKIVLWVVDAKGEVLARVP
jgi:hypothetical protein